MESCSIGGHEVNSAFFSVGVEEGGMGTGGAAISGAGEGTLPWLIGSCGELGTTDAFKPGSCISLAYSYC